MIFYLMAAVLFGISLYTLMLRWSNGRARIAFLVGQGALAILLILCGSDLTLTTDQREASRRVVLIAADVSASTGLSMEDFKFVPKTLWPEHRIEIIPFSDEMEGAQGANVSAIKASLHHIYAYLRAAYAEDEIAGMVVVTDGNETVDLAGLGNTVQPAGEFPLHVLHLQNRRSEEVFDKSITFIKTPRFVPLYQKETVTFAVSVAGGRLEGVPVELRLNNKSLGTVYVQLKDGYGEGVFDLVVKNAGMALLEASIAEDARETITDNNRDYSLVEGIIKEYRVLHISGHPSVDTAFVRRGLQNIPGMDVISFFILKKLNQIRMPENELSLIHFPTDQLFKNELENFDAIIINDFHLRHFLSSEYLNNIAAFVASGGGLLMFGGPSSFYPDDSAASDIREIFPVFPGGKQAWQNDRFTMQCESAARATALAELCGAQEVPFSGLNNVAPKAWSNVFMRTSTGHPLVTGGLIRKGRVLAVLTDSLWRLSYNGEVKNDMLLKPLIRYTLGITSMPVVLRGNRIFFDDLSTTGKDANAIKARLTFKNDGGVLQKEESLSPGGEYPLKPHDSRIISVQIENGSKVVDQYTLINYNEKKENELAHVTQGKAFLKKMARLGKGDYLSAPKDRLMASLSRFAMKDPVMTAKKKKIEIPLYRHKGILLLILYLAICGFFLKSKFTFSLRA